MALWRKKTLMGLLDEKETPWQFEVSGSARSSAGGGTFLCVAKRVFGISYVFTAVVNGYWSKVGLDYLESEKLQVNMDELPGKTAYKKWRDRMIDIAYRFKKKIHR